MRPSESPSMRGDCVEQEGRAGGGSRFPTMHYENIRAQDQPCQHNGNQIYYGPVIFQSAAAVSVAAAPTDEEIHKGILKSLVFDQMDSRFMGVRQNLVSTCEWLLNASEYKQ
jgi:hypothetical protein